MKPFIVLEHCLSNAVCSHLWGDEKLAAAASAAAVKDDGLLAPHCDETAECAITGEHTAAVATKMHFSWQVDFHMPQFAVLVRVVIDQFILLHG